jgi:hypothetical protein
VLLELTRCNLSYREAQALGLEEMLCLLHHAAFDKRLSELSAEALRVASLPLADPAEQQRALLALHHRAAAEVERFYAKK